MNKMDNEARKQNILAAVLAGALLLTALGIGGFLLSQEPAPQRNADTYCIDEEGGINAFHVILLDVSEEFTELQRKTLQHRMDLLWESVGPEERIDLYLTQQAGASADRPASSFCNPSESGNIWTEGEKIRERRHQDMWVKVEKEFETASTELGRDESPIIEALLSIGIGVLAEARYLKIPASLTIISDMLQNSQALNHYEEQPSFEDFKRRSVYERVKPDLGGAEISIWYLQRPGRESIQGTRHATFWASLLGDAGATFKDPAIDKVRSGVQ